MVDDIAILVNSAPALQYLADGLSTNAAKLGLRISSEKSKMMQTGLVQQYDTINCSGTLLEFECVDRFTYLRSVLSSDGDSEEDVKTCMAIEIQHFDD